MGQKPTSVQNTALNQLRPKIPLLILPTLRQLASLRDLVVVFD